MLTRTAIIGYTGFVGSHIKDNIDTPCDLYNSKNIHEIHNKEYDLIYMAGLPATKWLINKEPEKDMQNMLTLQNHLSKAIIHKIILISTIDIYDKTKQLQNEDVTKVTEEPYGKHRFIMEKWVKLNYPNAYHIIRLPALFGVGLKKNIIYDLLHDNNINSINPYTFYQWYDISHLMYDIEYVIMHNISVINVFSEPIWTFELIKACFPNYTHIVQDNNCPATVIYNYKTKYSPYMNGYAYQSKDIIFYGINKYVQLQKKIDAATNRLIVSNLAWDISWEDRALDILSRYGINGVELALTKYGDWNSLNEEKLAEIKEKYNNRGITIHSLQSIFFGIGYNVFINEEEFVEHFKKVIKYAGILGATKIVFGSPKNRIKPDNMLIKHADDSFINTMKKLVEYAKDMNVIICLEPNAAAYTCNYITHLHHALNIVQRVNHPNFRINYDTGNAFMTAELSEEIFNEAVSQVGHIQVSLPFLDEIKRIKEDQQIGTQYAALALAFQKYPLYVSLEMKQVAKYPDFQENIHKFVSLFA